MSCFPVVYWEDNKSTISLKTVGTDRPIPSRLCHLPYNCKDPGFSPKTQQTLNEQGEGGKAENSKTLGVLILGRLYIQKPRPAENLRKCKKKIPKNKVILEFGIYPI